MLSPFNKPHEYLGLKKNVIRLLRPAGVDVFVEIKGRRQAARRVSADIFEIVVNDSFRAQDYKVFYPDGRKALDPYIFAPKSTLAQIDSFQSGKYYDLYNWLGAHVGKEGVRFSLWAPHAEAVYLVGDFNHWQDGCFPMAKIGGGIFELFMPGLTSGERYKYAIHTAGGDVIFKSDPMAFAFEKRPGNASMTAEIAKSSLFPPYTPLDGPINIYEVHLGSWRRKNGRFKNYRDLAEELASYCKMMSFTHIELLPVMEHPLDESWGYQVTGFFAPTSRFGSVADFGCFVDHLHKEGIGVILDWVPGHFPVDEFALGAFDGSPLYETADVLHPEWQTRTFDYAKPQVTNFLIASALFWLDKMQADGLRVDGVSSILYKDFGLTDMSEPDVASVEFLKHLNYAVHQRYPKALMIAEESSAYKGVSHPLESDGLGFDMKWNMGWMNDTLKFFQNEFVLRPRYHSALTFSLMYAFQEQFLLPFSHDEVVHAKRSLISKMPGTKEEQFANLRLMHSYMMCHPGKKLFFMGGEIAQFKEWNCAGELDWHLLEKPFHMAMQVYVREMNRFYLSRPALWELDFKSDGFEWIDFTDNQNCVISYWRKGREDRLICVHNFMPQVMERYWLPVKAVVSVRVVFNTDLKKYGKAGLETDILEQEELRADGFSLRVPPLATVILEVKRA